MQAITVQEIDSKVIKGQESPIQGWYSEDHHRKCPAPTLIFEVCQSSSVFVAWLIYPLSPGEDAEQYYVKSVLECTLSRLVFDVQNDDKIDSVSIMNCANATSTGARDLTSTITIIRDGQERWSIGSVDAGK